MGFSGTAVAAEGAKAGGEALAAEGIGAEVATMGSAEAFGAGALATEGVGAGVAAGAGLTAAEEAALTFGTAAGGAAAGAGEGLTAASIFSGLVKAAPVVSAATSLLTGLGAIGAAPAPKAPSLPTPPTAPALQPATDADVTAIRKKNSVLFGADSPASTDITAGSAGASNLGKSTLLGGVSTLGS